MTTGPIWSCPPKRPILTGDAVHVWSAVLDQPAPDRQRLARTLASAERQRAARFRFDLDRNRFTVRRGVLRAILARYLQIEPDLLQFAAGQRGKPVLAGDSRGVNLQFNASHSNGLALFAVARDRAVGVDLERLDPRRGGQRIAERFFSPGEVRQLRSLPAAARLEGFFNGWTRKEAYVKARGEGLAMGLDSFEVSLRPSEPARLLWSAAGPAELARWHMETLPCPGGFVGALVAEQTCSPAVLLRWTR